MQKPGVARVHVSTLLRQRVFQIACDHLPQSGADLSSQPTMSRFENRVGRSDLYRIASAFADAFIASYAQSCRVTGFSSSNTAFVMRLFINNPSTPQPRYCRP